MNESNYAMVPQWVHDHITKLETENAALWAFVRADSALTACHHASYTLDEIDICHQLRTQKQNAREALRQYEEET